MDVLRTPVLFINTGMSPLTPNNVLVVVLELPIVFVFIFLLSCSVPRNVHSNCKFWISLMKVYNQISTNPDESIQPWSCFCFVF